MLGKNKIERMLIPPLSCLVRLSLQSNRLKELDDSLSMCRGLKELYISENALSYLPPFIASLEQLVVLDIGCNKIDSIDVVKDLSVLKELWANDNKITSLSALDCLAGKTSLETIYLEGNRLQSDLGPGYKSAILNIVPGIVQLDGIMLKSNISFISSEESPKPIASALSHKKKC